MSEALSAVDEVRRLITVEPPAIDGDGDGGGGVQEGLDRLCRAAARALLASGAGVSVMTEQGEQGVVAASDTTSRVLEELQFTLGEGPCRDAYTTRSPVLVPDLLGETGPAGLGRPATERWPGYAQAVHSRGVRAVFAFPLTIGVGRLGVLDVYRDAPGWLSKQALAQAQVFADVALMTLLDGQESSGGRSTEPRPQETLDDRLVVHQAQGMVMVQLHVPLAEAMVRLRAHAYSTDRRLSEVAMDIVARRVVLTEDQHDG